MDIIDMDIQSLQGLRIFLKGKAGAIVTSGKKIPDNELNTIAIILGEIGNSLRMKGGL